MTVEYAPRGLVGVLTPQANTTVEPEFSFMWPAGVAMINARLMSKCGTLEERLMDYFHQLPEAVMQFHNAPVKAIALACTGASYLATAAKEKQAIGALEAQTGVPFITAGRSVQSALNVLGARKIALVSPYPVALTEASIAYWNDLGFEVTAVVYVGTTGDNFHPIYSIRASSTLEGLMNLEERPLDAVVMLGTGMPTLQVILQIPEFRGAPVMSCMLALGWASARTVAEEPLDKASLLDWIAGKHWRKRFEEQQMITPAPA